MAAFVIVAAAAALLVSAGVHAQTGERVPGAYGGSRRRGTADDQQLWLCDEESEPLDYAAELGSRTAGRRVLTNRQTEGAGVSPGGGGRGYADRHADRDPGWPGGRLVGPLPTGRDRDEHGHGEGIARQGEQLGRRRHRLQVDYLGPAGNDHQVSRPGRPPARPFPTAAAYREQRWPRAVREPHRRLAGAVPARGR